MLTLGSYANKHNVPFQYFSKINDEQVYSFVKDLEVDLLFVIGLSQMVKEPLLNVPKIGIVGFHPTKLPKGRGRGAVAWMILGKAQGAATFFLIDEGMDSGPILGQREFVVEEDDYAQDVIDKIKLKIDEVLDDILPKLKAGELILTPQDHELATYLGQRKPKDGLIDWKMSAEYIHKLIRATSEPLPGAFTFSGGNKITVYRATIEKNILFVGVPGRVLDVKNDNILVATGNGALWINQYIPDDPIKFRIGLDLG